MKLHILQEVTPYNDLVRAVKTHKTPFLCVGLSHIHKAHFAASLREDMGRPVILIVPDEATAVRFSEDIRAFLPDTQVMHYPAREWMLRPAEAAGDRKSVV